MYVETSEPVVHVETVFEPRVTEAAIFRPSRGLSRSVNDQCCHRHAFRATAAYAAAQREVDRRWGDQSGWRASTLRNVANVGWFSSDRTIAEYARDIWGVM